MIAVAASLSKEDAACVWMCQVCGWTYDEAIGDPDSGIAPGTRWQDIAEDWCCPDCGIAKAGFDMVLI